MRAIFNRLLGGKPSPAPEPPPITPNGPWIARAIEDADRRSPADPAEHWIFDHFPDSSVAEDGYYVCRLGSRTRFEFVPKLTPEQVPLLNHPSKGEEYFEWIDVLQSAYEAGPTYTFLELGAGWGRWSSRAAMAARCLGKTIRLGAAEAEPQHLQWLRQHLEDNVIPENAVSLYPAAVGGSVGLEQFLVAPPADQAGYQFEDNARDWYGQTVFWDTVKPDPVGEYFGRPMYESAVGWRTIEVDRLPFSQVLAAFDFVDLADFDTQGAEADAIEEALEALQKKVRKLHIGTHGHDLEARLRTALGGAGWTCLRDFPCHQTNATSFGEIAFVDGVQTWLNPAFAAPPAEL